MGDFIINQPSDSDSLPEQTSNPHGDGCIGKAELSDGNFNSAEMAENKQSTFLDNKAIDCDNVNEYIDDIREGSPSTSDSMSMSSSRPESQMSRNSECPSAFSNRTDNMGSILSIGSFQDNVRNTTPEYSVSRESSFAFLRESSNMSSGSSKDEFVSARESLNSSCSGDSRSSGDNSGFQNCVMVNQLQEGPVVTLPTTQQSDILSTVSSPSHQPEPDSVSTQPTKSETVGSTVQANDSVAENADKQQENPPQAAIVGESMSTCSLRSSSSDSGPGLADKSTSRPTSNTTADDTSAAAQAKARVKKTPNDFIFGKVIGEGSYSTVYLAKEVSSQTEFAIKVCDKKHLIRERKTHFVMREKEVLMKLDHPYFIKLAYTFQDPERLYYVLTYARSGELLGYMHKLSAFDVPCTRFYTAEIVLALEYLHSLGIIHRDLKPENILLSEDMHIKITDFGTSKILSKESQTETKRKNSFVGTAEYVSPEVLNNDPANFGSDLWGLGCIIYQCLSGSLPFRCGNEYQTFQKIVKAEYDFPEGFHSQAKDLVQKLLVLEPTERLGMLDMSELKKHPFYDGLDWVNLPTSTPPKLMPYLPATANNPEFWGQEHRTGFDDQRLAEIITGQVVDGTQSPELEEIVCGREAEAETKRKEKLSKQRLENPFHTYVEDNLILRQGYVDKRKGLFARKRMLLLTEGPHLYYVDVHNKTLKGEIPWSKDLRPEAKNFKIFFVHTPNRTYYLESRHPDAHLWVKKIEEVWKKHYGEEKENRSS